GIARAQNEILAVHTRQPRWREQLDVVDLGAVCARDALAPENLANTGCDFGQLRRILDCNGNRKIIHEKEPVATPGYVTRYSAEVRHIHRDVCGEPIAGYILHGDLTAFMQYRGDHADGRFDAMPPTANSPEMSERDDDADRSVHAHSQVTDIVKENDAGRVCGIVWLAQQSAHDNVR